MGLKMLFMEFDKQDSIGDKRQQKQQKEKKGDSQVSPTKRISQLEKKGNKRRQLSQLETKGDRVIVMKLGGNASFSSN